MISMSLVSGLFCRWSPSCQARFCPVGKGSAELRDAGLMRDEHERLTHGYVHQVLDESTPRFGKRHTSFNY